jgi:hypothetical protein
VYLDKVKLSVKGELIVQFLPYIFIYVLSFYIEKNEWKKYYYFCVAFCSKSINFSIIKNEQFYFFADENNPLSQTIPDSPTELKFFIKLCEQRRKFPVLYKIEFTVSVV